MIKIKTITLCGSLKFQKEMMTVAETLSLEGTCILTPIYPVEQTMKTKKTIRITKKRTFQKNRFIRCHSSSKCKKLYWKKYNFRNRIC